MPGLDTMGMDASSLLWLSVYSPGYEVEPNKNGYRGMKINISGTFTVSAGGQECATPRYDYNSIMYRLNVSWVL